MVLPRPQKATALAVDECRYGRDVVPLSPAVRVAKRRNQEVAGACPPGNMAGLPVGLHKKFQHLIIPEVPKEWSINVKDPSSFFWYLESVLKNEILVDNGII